MDHFWDSIKVLVLFHPYGHAFICGIVAFCLAAWICHAEENIAKWKRTAVYFLWTLIFPAWDWFVFFFVFGEFRGKPLDWKNIAGLLIWCMVFLFVLWVQLKIRKRLERNEDNSAWKTGALCFGVMMGIIYAYVITGLPFMLIQ